MINKTKTFACIVGAFLLMTVAGYAQSKSTYDYGRNGTSGFYLGGSASTNGWGGELKYMISRPFTIRAGFETLNLAYDYTFDENEIDYKADFKYQTGAVFLLADFNFTKNLYLTGGVLFNSFNPKLKGKAASDLEFGDLIIPSSKVGEFQFALTPSLKVSPYGGAGVRSFIGQNKRVVLNFEGGVYYIGAPEVEIAATGLLEPTANPAHEQKELFEKQLEQYKFYPVVKVSVAVKLF